jgi:hypothetical protein
MKIKIPFLQMENKIKNKKHIKNLFLVFSLSLIFLITINNVNAVVSENNVFRYGKVNDNNNIITTTTPVTGVNVIGYRCTAINCNSVGPILWDGVVQTTLTDQITLEYPTILESVFGYGVYMYKDGYIPYEVNVDYSGNQNIGPFYNYLSKKESCEAIVTELNVNPSHNLHYFHNNVSNVEIKVKVGSPIKDPLPINYIPDLIKDHYKSKVNVLISVKQGSETVFQETKTAYVTFSAVEEVLFYVALEDGDYEVIATTSVDDEKCLSQKTKTYEDTFQIQESCNAQCNLMDYYEEPYCSNDDLFKVFHDFSCVDYQCVETIKTVLAQNCSNFCISGFCTTCITDANCGTNGYIGDKYCKDNNVYQDYKSYSCNNPATATSSCKSDVEERIVDECTDECMDGRCVEIACHNNLDCDDNNLYTEDTCISPGSEESFCKYDSIRCVKNDDCGISGFFGQEFCYLNDIYKGFSESVCLNPGIITSSCSVNLTDKLVNDCGDDFCNNETYVCKGNEKYLQETCYSQGCLNAQCFSNMNLVENFIEVCQFGCLNGVCEPECRINSDCPADEVCYNGECRQTICSYDADCGTDGFRNIPYCIGSSVYDDFEKFKCQNPGTPQSMCTNSSENVKITDCPDGCIDGKCANVVCNKNSDCGIDYFTGGKYCIDNNVYSDFKQFTCNNYGTIFSSCTENIIQKIFEDCGESYCEEETSNYCIGNDVYKTEVCYDKGCLNAECFSSQRTNEIIVRSCIEGCVNGNCLEDLETNPPVIELIYPTNGIELKSLNVDFRYKVYDESLVNQCSLILIEGNEEIVIAIDYNIPVNVENSFFNEFYSYKEYSWMIKCTDQYNNLGESLIWKFRLMPMCVVDSDCGNESYELVCIDDNSYKEKKIPKCIENLCSTEIVNELYEECDYKCKNGRCIEKPGKGGRQTYLLEDDVLLIGKVSNDTNYTKLVPKTQVIETQPKAIKTTTNLGQYLWLIVLCIGIIVLLLLIIIVHINKR